MNVLVIGANGKTGQLAVQELKTRGHNVTAFVRTPEKWQGPAVRVFQGDATKPDDVRVAMEGQHAVVVVLGIRENPLLVRIRGSVSTPMKVRSCGTRNVVTAMRACGLRRLVVQTTYGAGDTWNGLSQKWKILFSLLLKPQIADSEEQERVTSSSGLDWTVVRPVGLIDGDDGAVHVSTVGDVRGMTVSRVSVARVLADAAESREYVGKYISVSTEKSDHS
jgi:uncharacterized protein YbjT (DUF2867 family)